MRSLRQLTLCLAITALAIASAGPVTAIEELDTPASNLRVELDRLLSEHVFLTVQAMHAGLTDEDLFAAAAGALEANTVELEGAIAGIYGEEGGLRFGDLWRAHIGYVVDYTRARDAADEDAEQRAVDGMATYQDDFAAFLVAANPHLTQETVTHVLEDHLGQLQQIAQLQSGDYVAVYAATRTAYGHMFELGDSLSRAIVEQFPEEFPGADVAFGPATDLRIALDNLLGEHAFLAAEVMRQADGGPDAELAASDALAANGASLRAAIADIYGDDAGREFVDIWEGHNGYYVDYVRAVLADDAVARDRARDGLEEFGGRVGDFFVSASNLISPDAVRFGLSTHTDHLLRQVDAYGAGDYDAAFSIARDAHHHMGAISDLLATGIANQFPDRFLPDTAAEAAIQRPNAVGSCTRPVPR
ncbi:MAG: copper amine oxidase [Candidatus Limnocylindria bacterium]